MLWRSEKMLLLRRSARCHYHSDVREKLRFPPQIACIIVFLVSVTSPLFAQEKHEANEPSFNPAVYQVGERLTYNVSYAYISSAAHVELLVTAHGKFFNRDAIELRAHIETTGVVNVALYAINNDYTTYLDPQTGLPFRVQQVVREAGRTSEASIDYNQPAGSVPLSRSGDSPGAFDLVSAIYRIRGMPLNGGGSFLFTVRNETAEYTAEVRILGRQAIKTNVGSFNTIATRVNLRSGHDYNIRAFFSDDERHVPVLITARADSGDIRAELAGSQIVTPVKPATSPKTIPRPGPITEDTRPLPPPTPGSVTEDPKSTVPATNTSAGSDLPFKVGEQLNYRVYLADNIQPVGSITFAVRSRGRYFNRNGLLLAVTAQTSGLGGSIFVNDQITSYVDPETLLPFRTELKLAEGRWRATKGYTLDQNRGSALTDARERIEIPVGTHDMLSAIYAIRTFDLTRLKQNAISILATSKPRTLLINSQRRETIVLNGQEISAILLTLTTDDPQGDKLQLRVWVGDDSRHLPLRIAAVTPLGIARADLVIAPITSQ